MHKDSSFYHEFADKLLSERKLRIIQITKDCLKNNFIEIKQLVNSTRKEFGSAYNWCEETDDYFLQDLSGKWKYSFGIINQEDKIFLVNFSSLYGEILHYHFTYVSKEYRNKNLAKIHSLKLSQYALDNNLTQQEGYWSPNNLDSISLYQKLGWTIQEQVSQHKLLLRSDIQTVRDNSYKLLAEINV